MDLELQDISQGFSAIWQLDSLQEMHVGTGCLDMEVIVTNLPLHSLNKRWDIDTHRYLHSQVTVASTYGM